MFILSMKNRKYNRIHFTLATNNQFWYSITNALHYIWLIRMQTVEHSWHDTRCSFGVVFQTTQQQHISHSSIVRGCIVEQWKQTFQHWFQKSRITYRLAIQITESLRRICNRIYGAKLEHM